MTELTAQKVVMKKGNTRMHLQKISIYLRIIFVVMIVTDTLYAQSPQKTRIELDYTAVAQNQTVQLALSTPQQLIFKVQIPEVFSSEREVNGQTFNSVYIDGFAELVDPGKPALPVVGKMLAVPNDADLSVQILDARYEEVQGYYIRPAEEPQPESGQDNDQIVRLDNEIYTSNAFYPANTAWCEPIKIIRDCPVTLLWISPIQFNPVSKTLRIYTEIDVSVQFSGSNSYGIEPRFQSPVFETMLSRLVINWDVVQQGNENKLLDQKQTQIEFSYGCDFLIITAPEFLSAADSLALWRRYGGLETRVVLFDDIGSTADDIKQYIQTAYDT